MNTPMNSWIIISERNFEFGKSKKDNNLRNRILYAMM